jgi:threonine/homoserine/homoserine lactone efflux protein
MSVWFAEFLIASVVMELTPGPNMVWLALLAARQGRRAGFIAVAGIATGLALLAMASATGAAALITTYPVIYEAIRWAGVLFLFYLAFEAWNGEREAARPDDTGRDFRRGVVVNLLNPKAATVFVVLIPGFAGGPAATISAVVLMSAVYLAIATAAHTLIVTFAGSFQRFLSDPQREQAARRIFAVMLAGVAIWFALTSGKQSG